MIFSVLMQCTQVNMMLVMFSECISTPGKLEKYVCPRWESNPWTGIFFKLARCGYTLRVTSQASYSPHGSVHIYIKTENIMITRLRWYRRN